MANALPGYDLYAGGAPHLDELAFATAAKPGEAALLAVCDDTERQKLTELEQFYLEAVANSKTYMNQYNYPDPELQALANKHTDNYHRYRESLFEKNPALNAPVHRGDFDVSAPGRIQEKVKVPTMVTAAAMRMLINPDSGYFGTVAALNGDGKDHRFSESLARAGGMTVIPYDVPIDSAVGEFRHLKNAHPVYLPPVLLQKETTVSEARKILLGQLPDAAAYFVDENRQLKGIVKLADLHSNGGQKVLDSDSAWLHSRKTNFRTANEGVRPEDALREMEALNIGELPILDADGRVKYMMTEISAALSMSLQPFVHEGGFSGMFTVGVGPYNDMVERIDALMEAGACGFFLETAHAYRRDVITKFKRAVLKGGDQGNNADEGHGMGIEPHEIKKLRERYPNAVIGFGTVTEPEAVGLLKFLGVDIVKVGVGGGGHCSTFDVTGVGGYPFRSWHECGQEAESSGQIQIMVDGGVNSTRRFNIAAATHGTCLVQFGTWFGATVQSASAHELVKDEWRKKLFGEASAYAEERRRAERGITGDTNIKFRVEKILGIHSEGKVGFAPVPSFANHSHVGGIVLDIKRSLQSWGTYVDAKNMQQGQHRSRLVKISLPYKPA